MKRLTLLTATIALCACGSQENLRGMPALDTESQLQCARECEFVHGGAVRACSVGRTGATRGASRVAKCVDDAYVTLRACYRNC